MKRLASLILIFVLCCGIISGCEKKPADNQGSTENSSVQEETTLEYETGGHIDDEKPLVEISSKIVKEGEKTEYAAMWSDKEVLVVLSDKANNSLIFKLYDIVKGKEVKKNVVQVDESFLTNGIVVSHYDNKNIFVKSVNLREYLHINNKFEIDDKVVLDEYAQFDFITPDSSKIIYLDKANNEVISHNFDAGTQTVVYQFEPDEVILQCVGIVDDMDSLLFKYVDSKTTYTGYINVQLEEHTAKYKKNITYSVDIAGNDYVYYDYWQKPNELCFYSLDKPRQLQMFVLDEEKELSEITFFRDTDYFFTSIYKKDDDGIMKKFYRVYDKEQGALVEKISYRCDESTEIANVSMSPNTEMVCVLEKNKENTSIFIWNLTVFSGAIEENDEVNF